MWKISSISRNRWEFASRTADRSEMECDDMPIKYEIIKIFVQNILLILEFQDLIQKKNVKKINLLTLFPHLLEQYALVTF